MHFQAVAARKNWRAQSDALGYLSGVLDNPPYWIEALENPFCAVFNFHEIEHTIALASRELTNAALLAVDAVCTGKHSEELFEKLRIASPYREIIRKSWSRRDQSLYGRFDFSYNNGAFKLLELNFDTPVTLYESSILQRLWLQDLRHENVLPANTRQFSSLHEDLIARFGKLKDKEKLFHFSSVNGIPEEEGTSKYIESCASLAGHKTDFVHVQSLSYDAEDRLIDQYNRPIVRLFKLYPWENLLADDQRLVQELEHSRLAAIITDQKTEFFEPIWKILLSNKGILPILWEMNPGCRWLLASYFEGTPEADELSLKPHVRKPIFGRQGASISIVYPEEPERSVSNPGSYGKEGFILQDLQPLPEYNNYHIVIGSWVVDSKPAGIGLRADLSRITTASNSVFVPHYVID